MKDHELQLLMASNILSGLLAHHKGGKIEKVIVQCEYSGTRVLSEDEYYAQRAFKLAKALYKEGTTREQRLADELRGC